MSDLQHKTHPEYMEKSNLPNALPKQILQNNIHYTLIGDCYFPTCTLPLPTNAPIPGKFAAIYESCLQENHPSEYTRLL